MVRVGERWGQKGLLHLAELRDWLLGEQRKANPVVSTTREVPGNWTAPYTAYPVEWEKTGRK